MKYACVLAKNEDAKRKVWPGVNPVPTGGKGASTLPSNRATISTQNLCKLHRRER